MKKYFFSVVVALFLCLPIFSQVDTEFWFSVPYTSSHTGDADFHLVVFSYGEAATVTVEMPAASYVYKKVASIASKGSAVIQLVTDISYNKLDSSDTWQHAQDTLAVPFNKVSQRGLHVTSTAPVSCYLQISGRNGENYTLKGKNAFGTYFVVPMQNVLESKAATKVRYAQCYSSIQVVATEDNTTLDITPSAALLSGGSTSITLQRGETYAWRSSLKTAAGHLGGTVIKSNKPIVVNTTDDGAALNAGANERADIIGDQIVPTSLAGTKYIAVPKHGEKSVGEFVTLMAIENNTTFTWDGGKITLNSGEMDSVRISKSTYFESDKDASIFQVTNWNGETGGTQLPHLECTGSNLVCYKATKETDTLYFNIITREENIESITLNGASIQKTKFINVNNPDGSEGEWYYAQIEETKGVKSNIYTIEAVNGGLFHMAAIDLFVDSLTKTNIRSCCTYGYFSAYSEIHEYTTDEAIMEGREYKWEGHFFDEERTQPMVFSPTKDTICYDYQKTAQGCDSTCILKLHVMPAQHRDTTAARCKGDEIFQWYENTCDKSGDYTHTIEGIGAIPDTIVTLHFTLNLPSDSITTRTICQGSSFSWMGKDYTESIDDTIVKQNSVGCDSVCVLHLTVNPRTSTLDSARLCQGDELEWKGQKINREGLYRNVTTNEYGCEHIDSLVVVILNGPIVQVGDLSMCANDEEMTIRFTSSEQNDLSYKLIFGESARIHGFPSDTLKGETSNGVIAVKLLKRDSLNYIRPDNYDADLYLSSAECPGTTGSAHLSFIVNYPSWLANQHWNDVLAVLNDRHNGGYTFSAYQWYYNDEAIVGATNPYYYLPTYLKMGDRYHVALTREDDGKTFCTCDMKPEMVEDTIVPLLPYISVSPTGVVKENPVVYLLCNVEGRYEVYDPAGSLLMQGKIQTDEHFAQPLRLPSSAGCYIFHLWTENNEENRSVKVMVY